MTNKLSKAVQEKLFWLINDENERNRILNDEYKTTTDKKAIKIYNTIKVNPAFTLMNWDDSKEIIKILNEEYTDNGIAILFALYNYSNKIEFKSFTLLMFYNDNQYLENTYDLQRTIQGIAIDFPKLLSVNFQKDLDNINLKA